MSLFKFFVFFYISFFATSAIADDLTYQEGLFVVKCDKDKYEFALSTEREIEKDQLLVYLAKLDPTVIQSLLKEPCLAANTTFFVQAFKSFHKYCLGIEKSFYDELNNISKDETLQMEITEAIFSGNTHLDISIALKSIYFNMRSYCLVRDSLSTSLAKAGHKVSDYYKD